MRKYLVCDITVYIMYFSLYRLFANFTMETIMAAAFGQRVAVQQGESSVLVKAASEFFLLLPRQWRTGPGGVLYAPVYVTL